MAGTKRAKSQTAKRATPAAKKQKSSARTVKKKAAAPRTAQARAEKATAAAPLLASAPKKVGRVEKAADAVKHAASHQPKADVAQIASGTKAKSSRVTAIPAFDPLALAQPWMTLGFRMVMANVALQARIVRTAMDLPPTAAAMRQGSTVYKHWLAMLGHSRPAHG